MENEIVKAETQAITPAQQIIEAVKGGADLVQLKGVLELQEQWEAREAKKAYHAAMSAFKANSPEIIKDKKVSFGAGKASYNHASLGNVVKTINSELSKHGLSASWQTAQNGAISVTCKITHIMGHSEETTLSAQSDGSGSKNAIQAIGSTITYLQRYTLLALTGLATEDQDDDGHGSQPVEKISEDQIFQLAEGIDLLCIDKPKFLKYMKIESLGDMPVSEYGKAMVAIDTKRKAKVEEINVDNQ